KPWMAELCSGPLFQPDLREVQSAGCTLDQAVGAMVLPTFAETKVGRLPAGTGTQLTPAEGGTK
ncbi:MAG TPA: hypothetical protein VFH85_08005, partial [Gammaproteobacteria bacterium]|nr:hypothetical protein [Gammaproteobacteria bacterium]